MGALDSDSASLGSNPSSPATGNGSFQPVSEVETNKPDRTEGGQAPHESRHTIMFPDNHLAQAWYETAAQCHRNECYYRGLVVEIGEMLGDAAYISDDGSRQQDVLCAKVPELVRALLRAVPHVS